MSKAFVSGLMSAHSRTLEFHKITVKDRSIVIRPGDNVMMQTPNYLTEPNYVAKIVKILVATRKNPDVRVKIYWYYRPEDTEGGRKSFHGKKELISSDHMDTQSVDTIVGKCNVYTMKVYKKLDKVEENDFYYRWMYHCLTGDFSPKRVTVYCKCEMPENPDKPMLDCEECDNRFHPACIHMTADKAKRVKPFYCGSCFSKKRRLFIENSHSPMQAGDAESSNVRCHLQDDEAESSNVRCKLN